MERTKGKWGPYGSPDKRWEPVQGCMEGAPGVTICSTDNSEPICRVSGYLQPLEANAEFICRAVNYHDRLVEQLKRLEWSVMDVPSSGYTCPECGGLDDLGHIPNCKLDTLLTELEG